MKPQAWPPLAVDHIVVAAHMLDQGAQWCEATLGVAPGPGGEHALMGTHNRLLSLSSPGFPLAYLEIMAINPAAPGPSGGRRRWFGLDGAGLQRQLLQQGPQLVHWVARCTDIEDRRAALQELLPAGLQPGEVVAASRPTAQGLLQWQILLRSDGQTLCGGALPTLIQWQGTHPAASFKPSGLALKSVPLRGDIPAAVLPLLQAPGVQFLPDAGPALSVELDTPLGPRHLTCMPLT